MPKRFCACTGCTACGPGGHRSVLYDLDSTGTLRCPACQAIATRRRNARPGSSSRGLGWAFTRRKAADQGYQAATACQCPGRPLTRCQLHRGVCGEAFTPANPKTAGHAVPRSRGGGSSRILAVCRRCNSSDGGTLAHDRTNQT